MTDKKYRMLDGEEISRKALAEEERDTQLDVMRAWFFENYEDPAECTPYESREGGYIWIWGGPYDAKEELEEEFHDVVPYEVIEELAEELNELSWQWAPVERDVCYDQYVIDDIAKITDYYHNFSGSILDIEKLLESNVHAQVESCFYRLIYVNVFTSVETYLSDAFINLISKNSDLMIKLVESAPEFRSERISVSEIFRTINEIESRVKSYLADIVWHNLARIKPMYKDVLGVEFPKEIGALFKAVLSRHDIVHRNGKTKEGIEIIVTKAEILELIQSAENFVQYLDQEIANIFGRQSDS